MMSSKDYLISSFQSRCHSKFDQYDRPHRITDSQMDLLNAKRRSKSKMYLGRYSNRWRYMTDGFIHCLALQFFFQLFLTFLPLLHLMAYINFFRLSIKLYHNCIILYYVAFKRTEQKIKIWINIPRTY